MGPFGIFLHCKRWIKRPCFIKSPSQVIIFELPLSGPKAWLYPVKTANVNSLHLCRPSHLFPVFIYSMPGYTCSIKERMLYSSCKNRLLDEVERDYQLEVTKKVDKKRNYRHILCSVTGEISMHCCYECGSPVIAMFKRGAFNFCVIPCVCRWK